MICKSTGSIIFERTLPLRWSTRPCETLSISLARKGRFFLRYALTTLSVISSFSASMKSILSSSLSYAFVMISSSINKRFVSSSICFLEIFLLTWPLTSLLDCFLSVFSRFLAVASRFSRSSMSSELSYWSLFFLIFLKVDSKLYSSILYFLL